MTLAPRNRFKISALPEDFYARIKDRLQERIARELRFAGRVLDIGCGSCELARFLAEKNRQHVIGVDISDDGFANSRLRGETVECHKADARKLDFLQDESIDAVVTLYALHEMDRPLMVVKEAKRLLRAGGRILVVDFPRDSLAQRLWNEDYYTAEHLEDMLKAAGFTGIRASLIEGGQLLWVTASSPAVDARLFTGSLQSEKSRLTQRPPSDEERQQNVAMPGRTKDIDFQRRLNEVKSKVAGLEEHLTDVRRRIQKLTPARRVMRYAVVNRLRCTGCGMCEQVCPVGAIRVTYVAHVDTGRCTGCGICVESCPQGALSLGRR